MNADSTDSAIPLLHDYLLAAARRAGDKTALVFASQRLSYGEIERRSRELAAYLEQRGIERGDRVLVFCENGIDAVVAFWAVLRANAIVSMVNPQTKGDKLAYMLEDCRAAAIVVDAHLAPLVKAANSRHLRLVVVCGTAEVELPKGSVPLGGARLVDAPAPKRRSIESDLAAIIYTSGSTGEPKGVMHTHRSMMAAATSVSTYLEMAEEDRVLCALPLAFDYGLYQVIMSARVGATVVLERSFAYPAQVMERVRSERVSGFPGVPTMFAMLAGMKSLDPAQLSHVRFVTNTAAALPEKHITMLRKLFPHARIFSMYGLTECKRCTYLPPGDLERKPTSVGIAIPNTELWLVDEKGERVGPGEIGELVIRGPTVMRGYWEKPEATARRLRPGPIPGEMVLHTGDLCRLDDEGHLYFVARMDDVIKSRGEKVAPREVEHAIVAIRGVREAAVVGVPDDVLGQAIKAFVVLEEGASVSPRQIQHECHQRLESFMVPKEVVLVDALPRTTTGKIKKTDLR